jgi:hypothetical protein
MADCADDGLDTAPIGDEMKIEGQSEGEPNDSVSNLMVRCVSRIVHPYAARIQFKTSPITEP